MAVSAHGIETTLVCPADPSHTTRCAQLLLLNQELHRLLKEHKNAISEIENWASLKRITNDYELVCGANAGGVSRMTPISRSYFKMWEILHDHVQLLDSQPIKCAFLAEGPGGFVESVATFRTSTSHHEDELHCITLIQRGAPGWGQLQTRRWLKANTQRCRMHAGRDGTGDLYRLENIDQFAEEIGEESCKLVTADGGFDVSKNYDMQEQISFHLQLCETYAALRVQQFGGSFVLKVFDICDIRTVSLLWVLTRVYGQVKIVKPLTSRPANSEKYIVCLGYARDAEVLGLLRRHIESERDGFTSDIPDDFMEQIYKYNLRYVYRQVECIKKTVEISQQRIIPTFPRHCQVKNAMDWCHRYGISMRSNIARHLALTTPSTPLPGLRPG